MFPDAEDYFHLLSSCTEYKILLGVKDIKHHYRTSGLVSILNSGKSVSAY